MSEWIFGNRYLSESEMQNNATIIRDYLLERGWSLQAICGMLGNMQSESTINPGIWQNLDSGNYSLGFGLVQWTPATNYTDWAVANGYEITDGYEQLHWIDEQTTVFGQWIPTESYNFSFDSFKTSTSYTPQALASAFLKNFERAGVEVEDQRRSQAAEWYSFFSGSSPETPDQPSQETPTKKRKFNFLLFNKRRIRNI